MRKPFILRMGRRAIFDRASRPRLAGGAGLRSTMCRDAAGPFIGMLER